MNMQFFTGKKILVTGASGFIGHALTSSLASIDCSIIRVSRDKEKLLPLSGAATISDAQIDYSDTSVWHDLVVDTDIIFYLAAQTSSANANKDPKRDFQQNVLPLLNLLLTAESLESKPAVIFSSTATIAGLTKELPVTENVCANPITVYDIHKLCCENYLSYYAGDGLIKSCSLRLANVYGPGVISGSADRGILNMMIRRAIKGQSLSIYGDGKLIRDYTFITDIVAALLAAAEHIEATNGQHFNIGCGQGHTFVEAFAEIAHCAKLKLQRDIVVEHIDVPADLPAIETRDYIADASSFAAATGWTAKTDLRSGVQQTLDHYIN